MQDVSPVIARPKNSQAGAAGKKKISGHATTMAPSLLSPWRRTTAGTKRKTTGTKRKTTKRRTTTGTKRKTAGTRRKTTKRRTATGTAKRKPARKTSWW